MPPNEKMPERAAPWKMWAECFQVVNLKAGQEPAPGDIVVSRDPDRGSGHMVFVESYDSRKAEIKTVEAEGVAYNTVVGVTRPLLEEACGAPETQTGLAGRPVRADIRILRFDPHGKCPLEP